MNAKTDRLVHANALIEVISRHGRRFFRNPESGAIGRFEIDARSRIWWIDEYKGARVYTHKVMGAATDWRGFSHGGSLRNLIEMLRDYILSGALLQPDCIARPYTNSSFGDYWGYGAEATAAVRAEAHKLPMFPQPAHQGEGRE